MNTVSNTENAKQADKEYNNIESFIFLGSHWVIITAISYC
jgi:hypothetical protein